MSSFYVSIRNFIELYFQIVTSSITTGAHHSSNSEESHYCQHAARDARGYWVMIAARIVYDLQHAARQADH